MNRERATVAEHQKRAARFNPGEVPRRPMDGRREERREEIHAPSRQTPPQLRDVGLQGAPGNLTDAAPSRAGPAHCTGRGLPQARRQNRPPLSRRSGSASPCRWHQVRPRPISENRASVTRTRFLFGVLLAGGPHPPGPEPRVRKRPDAHPQAGLRRRIVCDERGGGETAPAEGFGGSEQGEQPPGMMEAVAWRPCQGRTRRPNAKGRETRRESLPREDASTSGCRPACFSPPVPFPARGERGCCFPRGCAGAGRPRVRAGHRAWRGRCCTPSRAA